MKLGISYPHKDVFQEIDTCFDSTKVMYLSFTKLHTPGGHYVFFQLCGQFDRKPTKGFFLRDEGALYRQSS